MITNWEEYRAARIEKIPGSQHSRMVPWKELLPQMSPQFRKRYVRARIDLEKGYSLTRHTVKVTSRKMRARRRRKK